MGKRNFWGILSVLCLVVVAADAILDIAGLVMDLTDAEGPTYEGQEPCKADFEPEP